MSEHTKNIWSTLQQAGVVQGDQPEKESLASPWYVKILLAFSGWLAAIFILGFIFTGFRFVFNNSSAAFLIGAVMIGVTFFIMRASANEFLEHLGLATSLAGQVLIVHAIFVVSNNETVAWLLVVLLEVPLVLFMPNFVHRVFCSFAAALALYLASIEMSLANVVGGIVMYGVAFCWLNEFSYPQHMKTIRAIGYGLVLSLIAFTSTNVFGHGIIGWLQPTHEGAIWAQPWLGELIIGVVAIYVVWKILQRYGQPAAKPMVIITLLGTLLICAVSTKVHGITVGMVVLLLGFSGSNRILVGLGIISLLFYISSYYYLLETTLLNKSQSLLIVGVVLLAVRWLMVRIVPMEKETQNV